MSLPKIAFTGGGTGGHIYPALAIAFELKNKFDIFYIGSDSGMDRSIVEGAGFRFYGIKAGKLRRYFSLKNISDVFKIIGGFFEARKILKEETPLLIFSKGGFASVPPVIAASSLKIPIWTHESDFSPGLATKINSFFASRIYTAYEQTESFFKEDIHSKIICAGNPVREVFRSADADTGRSFLKIEHSKKILLVLGGSQGAKEINDLVLQTLPVLTKYFFVVHQTGSANYTSDDTKDDTSDDTKKDYYPVAYIKDEMPAVLAAASLVLGRSGAGTVWESAAVGVPMLLVPLCGSGTRGDQVENAKYFTDRGAAVMLVHPSTDDLIKEISLLAEDENKLKLMAAASKNIGEKNAVKTICNNIESFCKGNNEHT